MDAPVPPGEWRRSPTYLIKNFPERPARRRRSSPVRSRRRSRYGRADARFASARSACGRDADLVERTACNKLGRLDPKTARSASTAEDAAHPLRTGSSRTRTAMSGSPKFRRPDRQLDPRTGLVTEYKMPDPNARDRTPCLRS